MQAKAKFSIWNTYLALLGVFIFHSIFVQVFHIELTLPEAIEKALLEREPLTFDEVQKLTKGQVTNGSIEEVA